MRRWLCGGVTVTAMVFLLGGLLAVRAQSTDYTTRIPVGAVQMYAGPVYPDIATGWIPADGRYLYIADWPELWAVLGCYYFCDENVGVFSIPNLIGQAPIMAGDDGDDGFLTPRVVGEAFGAEAHSLTILEMPAHSHTITDPGHTHALQSPFTSFIGARPSGGAAAGAGSTLSGGAALTTNTTGITINNTGSGDFFDLWQPSYALNFMIWGGVPAIAPDEIVITVVVEFPTHTPTPTLTPSPTPTEGPSPTPTATVTPTPNFITYSTYSGQDAGLVYQITAGDVVSVMLMVGILCALMVIIFMKHREPSKDVG